MAARKMNLLVVAHPDDETIFFGGLVQSEKRYPWRLICVTDGNADGRGGARHAELMSAGRTLGIKQVEQWAFPDRFNERLDTVALTVKLEEVRRAAAADGTVAAVYTHSILGDYGHPHHQDVSYAVHKAWSAGGNGGRGSGPRAPVWSVAYNSLPTHLVKLTAAQFRRKQQILTGTYRQETQRFIHLLPALATEGFVRVGLAEVEHLYRFLRARERLDAKKLRVYRWLAEELPQTAYGGMERPF
jgi:LmbE family N-acetylglucosaminyl deacetylase